MHRESLGPTDPEQLQLQLYVAQPERQLQQLFSGRLYGQRREDHQSRSPLGRYPPQQSHPVGQTKRSPALLPHPHYQLVVSTYQVGRQPWLACPHEQTHPQLALRSSLASYQCAAGDP